MRLFRRARRTTFATSMLVAIALVSGAIAYFTTTGSGAATASVTTLSAPASPSASASGTHATITWNASTIGGSVAATSYTVERYTSGGTDLGPASCSPVSSSSGSPNAFGSFTCTDSPGGGSYEYTITAAYNSWTAATGFVSGGNVQYATSTSASAPASDNTGVAISSASITGTLSGAGSGASGTLTFKVFGPQASAPISCTSGGTTVGTATIFGNGTYNPSAAYTPSSAGTYWWYASYGGDANNTASASTCGSGMASTVVKNTTTITAVAPSNGTVGTAVAAGSIGSTLSGATSGASGTITYSIFGPQASAPTTCTSGGTTVGTSTVSGNGSYTSSAGYTPSTVGTYWWYASYNGDASNTSSASTCGSGMASTVVSKANTSVTAGAPATDATSTAIGSGSLSAVLSGASSGASGTITFTVFGPQASAPTTCTSGGTAVGTATVSGNGTYNPSAGYTPSTAGKYWWYVSYNGDSNNGSSASTCGSGMTSTAVKNTTTISATGPATDTSGTAVSASSIKSTLAGGTSGASGTITYTVFGPQATPPTTCTSGGTTVGTSAVSGNGNYSSSAGFTPSSAGTYWWYVSYNGDGSNSASNGGCGAGMVATVVYGISSAATGTGASSTSTTTSSFTIKASTPYLLLISRASATGDSVSSLTSSGLSPSLSTSSFTQVASQSFSSTNWEWAYYFVSSSGASGSGTITINFGKSGNTIVDLVALSGASTGAPVVTGNVGTASGSGTSATANLPTAPASTDASVVMVGGPADFGASTPTASPSMTNLLYSHSPSGALATFDAIPGNQNETVTISSATWGAIALEISAPLGLSGNTTTTTAGASSTGTEGTPITASSISSALSGATSGATGTITFTVFGPEATAPTSCASGGTTVGTATVSGNGTYHPGAGFTPSSAGTYWWYDSYSGDLSSNQSSSSVCGSGMTSTLVATASTTTAVSGPGSDVSGTAISAASISSTLSGGISTPSGTVTYTVFGPQATAPTSCTSGGTTVGTATVSGNGTYHPSGGFTPSSAGTYWWYASYGGDSNNAASNSGCGSGMAATYVYSFTSVASAVDTTTDAATTTSSFTVQPSTTYLLLVFRNSSTGDGITSISSTGLSPSLSTASFTSITSQNFNTSDYQWAYYVTTASNASGLGTLSVNFTDTLASGQSTIIDVVALGGNSTSSPIATANEAVTNGNSATATANLPSAPSSSDAGLVFLGAPKSAGSTAPAASPAMTNAFYSTQSAGCIGVYGTAPVNQNESLTLNKSNPWGTIALEIKHP